MNERRRNAGLCVHLTTTHRADDPRVGLKEAATLARAGYRVLLIAPSFPEMTTPPGVALRVFPRLSHRWVRAILGPVLGSMAAIRERPAIIHVHDPELMVLAPMLRLLRIRFIFDAHENFPLDVATRPHHGPVAVRQILSRIIALAEAATSATANAVIGVHPTFAERFNYGHYITIANLPLPVSGQYLTEEVRKGLVSTGGLGVDRFEDVLREVARALGAGGLSVCGPVTTPGLEQVWRDSLPGAYLGRLGKREFDGVLMRARAGLMLAPVDERRTALSTNKLYEYLLCGLPIIATRIPAWEAVLGDSEAVRWVSNNSVQEIVAAMRTLEEPETWKAASMAARDLGSRFSWHAEGARLVQLYDEILLGA